MVKNVCDRPNLYVEILTPKDETIKKYGLWGVLCS